MDVLITRNCKHIANEFTLPKTYTLFGCAASSFCVKAENARNN